MYCGKNYIEKPIKLLTFDSLGHAILNQQALNLIKSIPKPISILSIAGPYRTGKSFLLNSLISSHQKFQVGQTTKSCTKGLWVWGKPITSVDETDKITNVLVLDSEGFGSCEDDHDRRIIVLALLLSTCFIYNSKGVIDADAIKDLDYVISQTKKIKRQLGFDSITDFHWILRDFHCQLINELGLQISADQYMEKSIKQFSDKNNAYKQMYGLLCQFFRNRTCHTLITPQTNPNIEQNPQFLQQLLNLKKIFNRIPSLDLNGETLCQILEAYVSAMNEDFNCSGFSREGEECQLRIRCLSKMCRQMSKIAEEQHPDKRADLLKTVIHEVESSVISKMKSCKQIKMLKQQINVLISEFDLSSPPKKAKQPKKQNRICMSLPKVREIRNINTMLQLNNDNDLRNNSRAQFTNLQRLREELESKIHRYELQLQQTKNENIKIRQAYGQIENQKIRLQEKLHQVSNLLECQQRYVKVQQMEKQEQIQQIRRQKNEQNQELHKQNRLLEQKAKYLEEKLAELQIGLMQSQSGISKKYKQQIAELLKQNAEIVKKHESEIRQLKQIYVDNGNDKQQLGEGKNITSNVNQLGQQIKNYIDKISKLQYENQHLQLQHLQSQHQISQLLHKYNEQQRIHIQQCQLLTKTFQQQISNDKQLSYAQIQAKDRMIKQIEDRIEQERKQKQMELQIYINKYDMLQNQIVESNGLYQGEVKCLKEQWVEACERLEIAEAAKLQKERQIQRLIAEVQAQRECLSRNYNQNFESMRAVREEMTTVKNQLQQVKYENNELKQQKQDLQKEIGAQKQQNEQYISQLKNLNILEHNRLQSKISSLCQANNQLQRQLELRQQQSQCLLNQQQQENQDLKLKLKEKEIIINDFKKENEIIKKQQEKHKDLIDRLMVQIGNGGREFGQAVDKSMMLVRQKQQVCAELVQKLQQKEKECYLMRQRMQCLRKQYEQKQKQVQKSFNDQKSEITAQLDRVTKAHKSATQSLQNCQQQILKLKQSHSLLQQRCEHQQELYQNQLQNNKQKWNRESQRMQIQINKLQNKCKKIQQENKILIETNRIFDADARETNLMLGEMRRKHDREVDQYEANSKNLRKRMRKLEYETKQLSSCKQKLEKRIEYMQECKQLLEHNYNQDFKLWSNKIEVYEQEKAKMIK